MVIFLDRWSACGGRSEPAEVDAAVETIAHMPQPRRLTSEICFNADISACRQEDAADETHAQRDQPSGGHKRMRESDPVEVASSLPASARAKVPKGCFKRAESEAAAETHELITS
jgi:hypothetical protein